MMKFPMVSCLQSQTHRNTSMEDSEHVDIYGDRELFEPFLFHNSSQKPINYGAFIMYVIVVYNEYCFMFNFIYLMHKPMFCSIGLHNIKTFCRKEVWGELVFLSQELHYQKLAPTPFTIVFWVLDKWGWSNEKYCENFICRLLQMDWTSAMKYQCIFLS